MTMQLMGFQEKDVAKLSGVRARLLGHDMGLGKTPMAIALDKAARKEVERKVGSKLPTLVVAPLSVLSTWEEHFADWQPDLTVEVMNPKNRYKFIVALEKRTADVYVMHWDAVRLTPELAGRRWL